MMEKEFDVIVVGELNVDLILNGIGTFPEIGKEVLAKEMALTLGSSSAIFASNISSLGARTAFIGKIGKDKFGQVMLENFRENKVDVSMIVEQANTGTGATIILNVQEDRAMITYPGAMELLTIEDISKSNLQKAKHLHFSSYYLQPGIRKDIGKLFRTAQELGLTTSFDMQWDPEEKWDLPLEEILPFVNIFLPNEQELMHLTGINDLEKAIDSIRKHTDILAIKRGNLGSMVCHKKEISQQAAFLNPSVIDAIGAGDSFNAGFVYKYLMGALVSECQKFGNLTGAVSTTAAGGTKALKDQDNFRKIALEKFGIEV